MRKNLSYLQRTEKTYSKSKTPHVSNLQKLTRMARFPIISRLFNYIDFHLRFKHKYAHLKPTRNSRNILCILPMIAVGGAEKNMLRLVQGATPRKHSFHLLVQEPSNNTALHKEFESQFRHIITPFDKTEKTPYYPEIDYRRLRYVIEKLDIDLLFLDLPSIGYENIQRIKTEFPDMSIVDVLHSETNLTINKILQTAPFIDTRVCISQKLKNYITNAYTKLNLSENYTKRLTLIYNGADTNQFRPNTRSKGKFKKQYSIREDQKIICFIGRFSHEKNPLLFVDIAREIVEKSENNLKFVMAGDGLDFRKVYDRVRNYGLQDHFILTGMIDNIVELLNDTDILLLVSKHEGISTVILEAMATGVPVISINVGAINEIVENDKNGFLITPLTNTCEVIQSFTDKALTLLKDQTKYRALSMKARETIASRFTLSTMISEYELVFDELIAKSARKDMLRASCT